MKGLTSLFVQYSDKRKRDGNGVSSSRDKTLDAIEDREHKEKKEMEKGEKNGKGGKGKGDKGKGGKEGKEEKLQTYFSEAARADFPLSESNMRSLLQVSVIFKRL